MATHLKVPMIEELVLDYMAVRRFHRGWTEDTVPEIMDAPLDRKTECLDRVRMTASRIGSRDAAVYWESARNRPGGWTGSTGTKPKPRWPFGPKSTKASMNRRGSSSGFTVL
jgi:hypothetical protein